MTCPHTKTTQVWVEGNDDEYGEPGHWETRTVSTTEDIDLHRYKCTRCGEVMYYSGRAREHYEKGTKFNIEGLE